MIPDIYGQLITAIQAHDPNTTRLFARQALQVPPQDLLHYAAQLGDLAVVQALLDEGWIEKINEFDDVSFTPLIWAARNGHINLVKLFLAVGANINAHDEQHCGNTALREVVEVCSLEMVRILVAAGADSTIPGWMQLTAIDKAKERAEKNPGPIAQGILDLLLTH